MTTEDRVRIVQDLMARGRKRAEEGGRPSTGSYVHCLLTPEEQDVVDWMREVWLAVWQYEFADVPVKRGHARIH